MLAGKLRLEPTVVGLSKFNESVQKLKNGQVAGYVCKILNSSENVLTSYDQSHRGRLQQGLDKKANWTLNWNSWTSLVVMVWLLVCLTNLNEWNNYGSLESSHCRVDQCWTCP